MNNIRRLREAKGLSQRQLARECGLCAPVICNVEAGFSISKKSADKIAKALNTTIEALFEKAGFKR